MANRRVQSYTAASERTIRASVSLPGTQYEELERIAQLNRVSVAWVVRDAVENYLSTRQSGLDQIVRVGNKLGKIAS